MKNAFLAMFVLAMAAVGCGSSNSNDKPDTGTTGAAGAGGGQPAGDPISQVCDKAESCQVLTTLVPTFTTADQCKQVASASLSAAPAELLPQVNQMLTGCLQQPTCEAFTECVKPLLAMAAGASKP